MKSFVGLHRHSAFARTQPYAILLVTLCFCVCLEIRTVCAEPSAQQEQELLLLEALSKRQSGNANYVSTNSLMEMLGRSKNNPDFILERNARL